MLISSACALSYVLAYPHAFGLTNPYSFNRYHSEHTVTTNANQETLDLFSGGTSTRYFIRGSRHKVREIE